MGGSYLAGVPVTTLFVQKIKLKLHSLQPTLCSRGCQICNKKDKIYLKLFRFISNFFNPNVELFSSNIGVINQYIFSSFSPFIFLSLLYSSLFFPLSILSLSHLLIGTDFQLFIHSLSCSIFPSYLDSLHFTLFLRSTSIIIVKCREILRKFRCSRYWFFFVFRRYRL